MFKKTVFSMLSVFVFCFWINSAFSMDTNDPDMKVLLTMAQKISKAKAFSVTLRMGYDVVQGDGEKIEFNEIRQIKLKRPGFIRVDATKSNGERAGLVFDGNVMSQYNLQQKVYAQLEKKSDLDGLIHYAVSTLNIRIPLARMLVTTFPDELKRICKEAYFVERDVVVAEMPTRHYVGRTDDVDFQVWIADDNLPRRLVITYKTENGEPQFWADFKDWNLSPRFSERDFNFVPEKGMERLPILIPIREKGSENTGGEKK